jgi:hypothetical protein
MRTRLRTSDEIRKAVIASFQRDFPGESINSVVFSTYILDVYCRAVENYDLCRQIIMRGVDIDL